MTLSAVLLIPFTTVLVVLATMVFLWCRHKAHQPRVWFHGIGVKFLQGATPDQPKVEEACRVIKEVIQTQFPEHQEKLLKCLWIEFHGLDAIIQSPTIPQGRLLKEDGTFAKIMGTCERSRITPFSKVIYVAKVRQIQNRDGTLRGAGDTALFHEIAEHIIPVFTEEDWNAEHDLAWRELSRHMRVCYVAALKGTA